MTVDHIGYAVKRIDRAVDAFEELGFTFGPVIDDTDRNVQISFGEKDGYRIELVCPLDRKQLSPVDKYLKEVGPTPYHICYQSERFDEELEDLQSKGFRIIIEPTKAIAFGGRRVAFLMQLGIGLFEIVEQ